MQIIRRSITIEPEDERTVQQLMNELGISRSAAIRIIIRNWKRENDRFALTNKGHQAINGANNMKDLGQS